MPESSLTEQKVKAPPVILLDGLSNTVSLCRSFGRHGIPVVVCGPRKCPAHFSRFCKQSLYPDPGETNTEFWTRALIRDVPPSLHGAVLIACNDAAIEFIADHHQQLRENFILEANPPRLRLALLNKKDSIEIAKRAGLEVPRIVQVDSMADVRNALPSLQMPILIRPIIAHEFTPVFGHKLLLCNTPQDVWPLAEKAVNSGVAIMLCEYVPGDDDRLCSYYTYMDDSGKPLFAFTKRVLRRQPYNFGEGTYHVTKWIPEVAEAGQRFFESAGLRGLGNVEFKLDPRDGRLKFIECNARFTAAHEILVKSKFNIDLFVYGQLTGRPFDLPETFVEDVRMSYIYRDYRAYRALRRKGKMRFSEWLKQTMRAEARPYFQWTDPLPAVIRCERAYRELLFRLGLVEKV